MKKTAESQIRPILMLVIGTALVLSLSVAAQPQDSGQEIYRRALPSVATLIVELNDGRFVSGTAFLAMKDGIAVTAWHVIKGARRVRAKFATGEEFEVSGLVDKDELRDVALIRLKVVGRPLLTLQANDPPVGGKAFLLGAPKGLDFTITDGLISQIRIMDGKKQIQFSCPASTGNSGGPLLNVKGEVVGVVDWQVIEGQNLNFAVPSSYVLDLDSSLPAEPWTSVGASSVEPALATGEWKLFSPRLGGFSVLMPGTPKEETEVKDLPVVGKGETHLFILSHESGVYVVSYLDVPGLARQDQAFCDSFGKGFLKSIGEATAKGAGGKVVSDTDISFGRNPGKEILIEVAAGTATARAYFIRRRGYELIAAPAAGSDPTNVKKFLDSFKATAP